jgi:hypothetical protein
MRQNLIQTCLLAMAFLALPAVTQAQFTYTTTNGTITITGYTGSGGNVTIPDTIGGLPVIGIGDYAFEDSDLTSVTVPNSATSIGHSAFEECFSLTNVIIGNGVISIGEYAFAYSSLTSVTIGNGVTSIGSYAFFECDGLDGIFFGGSAPGVGLHAFSVFHPFGDYGYYSPENATVYYLHSTTGWSNSFAGLPTVMLEGPPQFGTTTDGWNYVSDQIKNTLITGYADSNNAVVIPSIINGLPVTGIAPYAFYDSSLASVTIPDSVIGIGDSAFYECYYLTSVTIPNSVTSIGDSAFYECYSSTNVTIGNGVTNIGDSAFNQCSMKSVTIPNSVTSIGDYAFFSCVELTNLTIGNGVITIGDYAFGGTALTSVTIGSGVTSIGDYAFKGCEGLRNVTIGNSTTNIGDYAFTDCSSLISVYFSGNAPTADSSVFAYSLDYSGYGFDPATVYYLPGTLGWSNTFAERPTALWLPQAQTGDGNFGVRNNQFGFNINWTSGQTVVVEACTNLSNPVWLPVSTNTLVNGSSYFSDPQPANLPGRFYRLRSQ